MIIQRATQSVLRWYLMRYPVEVRPERYRSLAQRLWLQKHLEQIKPEVLPDTMTAGAIATPLAPPEQIAAPGIQPLPVHYQQYRCVVGNPLNCAKPLSAVASDPTVTSCPLCGFPTPMSPPALLVGRQGTYRVGRCLGQRGIGRLYEGIQVGAEQPVTIKEYLLPKRYFNDQERHQRQEAFLNLAGLSLADGRYQDMRIVMPMDAIAAPTEEKCYLVASAKDASFPLGTQLSQRVPLTSAETYKLLDQVLQTLTCLHQQKFTLPMGRVQVGIPHGNISLASLLWVIQRNQWFIYLTDLALWEQLFHPVTIDTQTYSEQEDLNALGYAAFYALRGATTDANGHPLNPRFEHHWPPVYLPLKQFILRLLAIDVPFDNAELARHALLTLSPEPFTSQFAGPEEVLVVKRRSWRPWITALIAILLLLGLGWLIWWILRPRPVEADAYALCCFKEVGAVPEGEFTYTSVDGDSWGQIFDDLATVQPSTTLAEQLVLDQPQFVLNYRPADSRETAIAQLRAGSVDFAVLPLFDPLPIDLDSTIIAYDGLAVVVAFNYSGRTDGLPQALNGAISLDTVQKIYTNPIDTWELINRSISLPMRRYADINTDARAIFEQDVLRKDTTIEAFQNEQLYSIRKLAAIPLLRSVIQDFEVDRVGSIGFLPLSSMVGQCSVYPLAIAAPGRAPVQPFTLQNGQPIQPSIDLCRRKGSYALNEDLLRSNTYPLAYPLAIVYLRDNRRLPAGEKFAELLLTHEGQQRLHEFGLVTEQELPPVQPVQ